MDAGTYPDPATVKLVHDHLIAVRVHIQSNPVLAQRFAVQYTPTVIILDEDGKEHHRSVGALPPQDFIPFLLLGIGKAHYENRKFKKSGKVLQELLSAYPESRWTAEASNLKRAADKLSH